MKKIFFFALASLALASCSQDEEFVAENGGGKQKVANGGITFSPYIAGQTRATAVTSASVKTSGFMVNATFNSKMYITNDEAANGVGSLDGTAAAQDGIFDTKGATYYWPITISDANPMMFYAFNKIDGASFAGGASATIDNAAQVNYTVKATAADQEDLVIASAQATAQPENGVQPMNFTHALSMVNFSIIPGNTNTKYTYVIKRIELLANSGEATCTIAETTESPADTEQPSTNTQAAKASWGVPASKVAGDLWTKLTDAAEGAVAEAANGTLYEYYNDAAKTSSTVNSISGTETLAFNENLMLYPNANGASDNKIAIRVYYKVVDNASGATIEESEVLGDCGYNNIGCKTVVIDDAAWEAGKAYRYTLTLPMTNFIGDKDKDGVPDDKNDVDDDVDGDGDDNESEFAKSLPIRFSVTVSAWETAENNTNITIK